MSKQTAVEYLEQIYLITGIHRDIHFRQAKEMKKQQILDAYDKAQYDYDLMRETDSEQYYNETFKK